MSARTFVDNRRAKFKLRSRVAPDLVTDELVRDSLTRRAKEGYRSAFKCDGVVQGRGHLEVGAKRFEFPEPGSARKSAVHSVPIPIKSIRASLAEAKPHPWLRSRRANVAGQGRSSFVPVAIEPGHIGWMC